MFPTKALHRKRESGPPREGGAATSQNPRYPFLAREVNLYRRLAHDHRLHDGSLASVPLQPTLTPSQPR
jgi:hypothetical protein